MYKPHFFTEKEFNNCTPSCSMNDMNEILLQKLDIARHYYDDEIHLTSAYRSSAYDLERGRSGKGAHTIGAAVDILCTSPYNRIKLVRALLLAGFLRIGVYDSFVHADIDTRKIPCMWITPAK